MAIAQTEDGIVFEYPDGTDPASNPDVIAKIAAKRARMRPPEARPAIDAAKERLARQQAERDRIEQLGPAALAGENLMAGLQNLGMGARQLGAKVGIGKGVSDEEVRNKRMRDDALAEASDMGIMPDWFPTAGRSLQVTGEVAPTLLVPGGAYVKGAQMAGRGAKVLQATLNGTRAAQAARAPLGAGAAVADSMMAGAATGALTPTTSDESKLFNMGAGAAGGAVVPAAVGGYRAGRKMLTKAGRTQQAGERLVQELGDDAAGMAARASLNAPQGVTRDVPISFGELTGDPRIAMLERKARTQYAPQWTEFDRGVNEGLFDAIDEATRRRANLPALASSRDALTGSGREAALNLAGRYPEVSKPLTRNVDDLMASSAARTPQRQLAKLMQETISENPTAAQLYETRKLLASKLSGPSQIGDETSAIVKGSQRETAAMIDAIDARLNEASDGVWGNYLSLYRNMSKPINNARALDDIYKAIDDPTVARVGVGTGARPEVTRTRLTRAVEKFGTSDRYGNRLDAKATRELGDVTDRLRANEEYMRSLKKAGTGGGGSNTAMDLTGVATDAAAGAAGLPPVLTRAISAMKKSLDVKGQQELSQMLMNPQEAAAAIRAALAAGQPLTPAQRAFSTSISRAPIATLPATQSSGNE